MPISIEEQQWRAEEDARVLAESKAIHADQKRFMLAMRAGAKMAEEKAKEAKSYAEMAQGLYPSMEKKE